jgi:hypothetical protein
MRPNKKPLRRKERQEQAKVRQAAYDKLSFEEKAARNSTKWRVKHGYS